MIGKRGLFLFAATLVALGTILPVAVLGGGMTDKGTQPPLTNPLLTAGFCLACHGDFDGGNDIEPGPTWTGSMMAQSARDPLFWAAMDVSNNDVPGSGDFCLRCHVPQGWLAGRSEPPGGSVDGCALEGPIDQDNNDFEGVSCHLCHRMMVNLAPPPGEQPVYYENAEYWVDDGDCDGFGEPCRRGPYDYDVDMTPDPPHVWEFSQYHIDADLCGNCHNVTSPTRNLFDGGVDSGVPFPLERTFREWEQSAYSNEVSPAYKSCQNCHMPDTDADPAYACAFQANDRTGNMAVHRFAGGNAWVPDVIRQEYPNLGIDNELLASKAAALDMLQNQSATLAISAPADVNDGGSLDIEVVVTNNTGHKLPTGYPEGRRMWLHVEARDGNGALIWEVGDYDPVPGILDPAGTTVYEAKQGIWNAGLATCETTDGLGRPEFHFSLNDCVALDNRIPPLGFTGGTDLETKPVDHVYPETSPGSGVLVNFDRAAYSIPIPGGTVTPVAVNARLRYQTTSKEYVEFLLRESVTEGFADDCIERVGVGPPGETRAQLLYDMWDLYDKAAPVDMAADSAAVNVNTAILGEPTNLLATSFNAGNGDLDVTYDPATGAADHHVYLGDLSLVGSLTLTERACAVGTSGIASFPTSAGSWFWLIVATDGVQEGTFGSDSVSVERAVNQVVAVCP